MTRASVLLTSLLLLGGCAGPAGERPPARDLDQGAPAGPAARDGASLDGTWRATDAELGSMTVVISDDEAVVTAVDGQVFEVDGSLGSEDGATELRATAEVGDPGLQILFGPQDSNDVEGTINFAMGEAELAFRRRGGEPFVEGRFWRASRPERTLKTIRLTRVPGKP